MGSRTPLPRPRAPHKEGLFVLLRVRAHVHVVGALDQEIRRRCRRRSSFDEGARLKIWELQRQDQSTRCHPLDRSPRWTHTSSGSSFPSRCVALGRPGRARSRCLALALREALARAADPARSACTCTSAWSPVRGHLTLAAGALPSFDYFGVQASFAIRRRLQERSRCSGQTDARVPGPLQLSTSSRGTDTPGP